MSMNANTHSKHAYKQPNRLLVLLHLLGTHFKDLTCQWNQADKQKRELSLAARCYSSSPLLLHFNLLNSIFSVLVDVHTLLRHHEIHLFYLVRPQANINISPSALAQAYTHPQQCRGCYVKKQKQKAQDALWELKKIWEYKIRNGKNNRMKSQDACWSGVCL